MNLVERVLPIFEAHKNEEEIEIEIRLGKHNGSLFDTNVGKDTWKRVLAVSRSTMVGKASRLQPLMSTITMQTTFVSPVTKSLVNRL